jgi:hypothetical protein
MMFRLIAEERNEIRRADEAPQTCFIPIDGLSSTALCCWERRADRSITRPRIIRGPLYQGAQAQSSPTRALRAGFPLCRDAGGRLLEPLSRNAGEVAISRIAVRGRRVRALQHRSDVGGEGREAVDEVADLARGDAVFDRQSEDVDQLLAGVAEEMGADDAVGLFVDQYL